MVLLPGKQDSTATTVLSIEARLAAFKGVAMKAEDVSAIFNISTPVIYREARAGKIPCIRFRTSIRFDPKRMLEWYRQQCSG